MRVVLDGGETIELGTTEETPTIGIVDYSRRVTDDFGVTTVVPRGFARRMSVRLAVPTDDVDALQLTLAALRGTPARWVADDRFAWLDFRGFYKEFQVDLAIPPLSYCTLTVEGLAASEPFDDPGGDPAPAGGASTLQVLQPAFIPDVALLASSVAEDDYPEWLPGKSYAVDERVIKASTHRIYESVAAGNLGNDPTGNLGKWLDVGPTNRWALLDQALGSATSAAGLIELTLDVGTVDAVALLDVSAGAVVHVETASYARSSAPSDGRAITFLDLPGSDAPVTVTIVGTGAISVGTLLLGRLVGLGETEQAPTAGITDYSRAETDEFGEVTVVKRDWAKRMSTKALISTGAIDLVAGRIAAVRARPALWIGAEGLDVLIVFGFFRDFSIEVGEAVSKLSLSIEGLSTAGKVAPLGSLVEWHDIADPFGTKPQDHATYGAPGNSPVGSSTGDVISDEVNAAAAAIEAIHTLNEEIITAATSLREDVRQIEIGGNLLMDSTFADGTVNWGLVTNEPELYLWGTDNADFVVPGEHYQGLACTQRNGDLSAALISEWVSIDKRSWVQISAWLASRQCLSLIRLQWADEDKNYIGDAADSDEVYHPHRGGPSLADFKRVWCIARIPDTARFARFVLVKGGYLENPLDELSASFLLRPMLAVASYDQTGPSPYLVGGGAYARANARIEHVETIATGAGAAAAQLREILAVDAGGASARLNSVEQVSAVAFDRVSGARWSKEAVAGNGRAQLTVYAYDNNGNLQAGVDIMGDVTISGDLTIDGTLRPRKIDASLFAREGTSVWTGGITPAFGQSLVVPFSLTLNPIQPQGRFLYELYVGVATNANTQQVSAHMGSQLYTNFVADGGLYLRSYDDQGNTYVPRHGGAEGVRATTVFGTTFVANVSRGGLDTGIVRDGDYYYRNVSATYTLTKIDLHVTWIAV